MTLTTLTDERTNDRRTTNERTTDDRRPTNERPTTDDQRTTEEERTNDERLLQITNRIAECSLLLVAASTNERNVDLLSR